MILRLRCACYNRETLNKQTSKFTDVIKWSEFQIVWVLLALVVVESVLIFYLRAPWVPYAAAGLLIVIAVLAAAAVYFSAKKDRDTSVERSELKGIFGSINDGLIVYQADFRVIFFNTAA